jgi:hypothetical protein
LGKPGFDDGSVGFAIEGNGIRGGELDGYRPGRAGEVEIQDDAGNVAGFGYGGIERTFGGGAVEKVVSTVDNDLVEGVVLDSFDLAQGDFAEGGDAAGIKGGGAVGS